MERGIEILLLVPKGATRDATCHMSFQSADSCLAQSIVEIVENRFFERCTGRR